MVLRIIVPHAGDQNPLVLKALGLKVAFSLVEMYVTMNRTRNELEVLPSEMDSLIGYYKKKRVAAYDKLELASACLRNVADHRTMEENGVDMSQGEPRYEVPLEEGRAFWGDRRVMEGYVALQYKCIALCDDRLRGATNSFRPLLPYLDVETLEHF